MHSFGFCSIIVSDPSSQGNCIFKIPCSDSKTADLVSRNLQSLYPNSRVQVKVNKPSKKTLKSQDNKVIHLSTENNILEDELEKDLFEDIAS